MKDLYYILLIVLITLILSGAGAGAVKRKRNKDKKGKGKDKDKKGKGKDKDKGKGKGKGKEHKPWHEIYLSDKIVIKEGGVQDYGKDVIPVEKRMAALAHMEKVDKNKVAIVNAANVGGVEGGGIDGAINNAGGKILIEDRKKLPKVKGNDRILEGGAVTTGPNDYGELYGKYVIHAVGPDYRDYPNYDEADEILISAYESAMKEAERNNIEYLGFCLISASIFRENRSLEAVITIGVDTINENLYPGLKEVCIYGFKKEEYDILDSIYRYKYASR